MESRQLDRILGTNQQAKFCLHCPVKRSNLQREKKNKRRSGKTYLDYQVNSRVDPLRRYHQVYHHLSCTEQT